uniref:PNT domain-containing protein n=1 Tax=Meloidogyne floridensis TaxID=298350 RepID=A0A915NNC3_9BILA
MKLKCQRGHKDNKNEYGKEEGEDEEEEEEDEDEEDEEISKDLNNFEISIIKSEQSSFTQSQSDTELLEEGEEEEKNGEDQEKVEIFIKKINNNQQSLQRICKIEQNRTYQPQQEYCEDNNNVYLLGQQQPTDQTEIYRELILRHLIADITSTCAKLGLPTELALWSADDSRRWVAEMCTQFQIQIPPPESFVNLNGQRMLNLGVEEFQQRFPDGGDTLHAQLQLWKTAFESCGQQQQFIEINNHNREWTVRYL